MWLVATVLDNAVLMVVFNYKPVKIFLNVFRTKILVTLDDNIDVSFVDSISEFLVSLRIFLLANQVRLEYFVTFYQELRDIYRV